MSRTNIVQLIVGFSVGDFGGGAELFGIRMAELLNQRGFDVTICNLWWFDTPVERRWHRLLTAQGIGVRYGAPWRNTMRADTLAAFAGMYRHIRALRPDIINSHTEYADLIGTALKLAYPRARYVRTGHTVYEWPTKPQLSRVMHTLYPLLCAAEVGVSAAVAAQLDQRPAAQRFRTHAHYIPNAVDAEVVLAQRSEQPLRATLGIAPDAPLFGTVARLMPQKDIPTLLRAMQQVHAVLPDARLLVVGKGYQEPEMRALIKDLDAGEYITLLGGRTDAIDLIATMDVFVLSSLWEGLPTVVMEAMILGTPVVTTNVAGTRDLVRDGETGRLVPAGDPAALAHAMIAHYRDRDAAQRMAHNAQTHVQQFSMSGVAEQYAALYETLVS